jgi:hypothetical protein
MVPPMEAVPQKVLPNRENLIYAPNRIRGNTKSSTSNRIAGNQREVNMTRKQHKKHGWKGQLDHSQQNHQQSKVHVNTAKLIDIAVLALEHQPKHLQPMAHANMAKPVYIDALCCQQKQVHSKMVRPICIDTTWVYNCQWNHQGKQEWLMRK